MDKRIKNIGIVFLVLQILDAYLTIDALSIGHEELNPIINYIIEYNIYYIYVFKLVIGYFLLVYINYSYTSMKYKRIPLYTLYFCVGLFIIICLNNLYWVTL